MDNKLNKSSKDTGQKSSKRKPPVKLKNNEPVLKQNTKHHDYKRSFDGISKSIKMKDIEDYVSTLPKMKPLLHNLINEGDIVAIVASTGAGKSSIAIQLAISIADGKLDDSLSCFEVDPRPKKVGYIDFELGGRNLKLRYSDKATGEWDKRVLSENLIYHEINGMQYLKMIGEGLAEKNKRAREYIRYLVAAAKLEVLFIDNISDIADQMETAKDATPFIKSLIADMKDMGITLILLAHTNKTDHVRKLGKYDMKGSSVLMQALDSIIGLSRASTDENVLYLKHTKYRNHKLTYGSDNVICFELEDNTKWLKFVYYSDEESLLEMTGKKGRRKASVVTRFAVYQMSLEEKEDGKKYTLTEIGDDFGISHTTVKKWCDEIKSDADLLAQYKLWERHNSK